jgi:alpha,alpha-trehalose phosphorylase
VIGHPCFTAEPWALRETALDLDVLAQSESVFALSNGHLGMRGNLDEGDPYGFPGTYLNGVHELRPLPYAETAYGNPEASETIINVTNGKVIRLLVGDEQFDLRYGDLLSHERVLDLRAGVLRRSVRWRSPTGQEVQVRSSRIVSFAQRGIAAILYEVQPTSEQTRLVVQSELLIDEEVAPEAKDDPRAAAVLRDAIEPEEDHVISDTGAFLLHRTKRSDIRFGAAMEHKIYGPHGTAIEVVAFSDGARVTVAADVPAGETLQVVKFIAYGWSSRRSRTSVRAQILGALAEARHTGWDGLLEAQRATLDAFWERADVEVDGDPGLQLAVRFALFGILQAAIRGEERAIPAKGLTGAGYDGHAFWDSESFVLPVLTYTAPDAAAEALRWRLATLDQARERARQLGLAGAAFPWRTIAGRECSGYWPAGTAALHVGADIADAVVRQQDAAPDPTFARDVGLPLLVETARLWQSVGHHDLKGRFRIPGVTGPDEYSAIRDDNVYTNLMARRNLEAAADAADAFPDEARALGVDEAEIAAWRKAAEKVLVGYDSVLGIHQQSRGFTELPRWDFEGTRADQYPLLLHFPYFELYRMQVIKQADLVMALYRCGEHFTDDEKAANFAYYEELTVRDSSLSACVQSIVAAETGHMALAYDYLGEAAFMDLGDLEQNTADGVHIASLAGSWLALVGGFGGLRDHGGRLRFSPRLPDALTRLAFRLAYRGHGLRVDVLPDAATYTLVDGAGELAILHEGEEVVLQPGEPQTLPLTPPPQREPPRQPPGREPRRRVPGDL